MRRLEQTKGGVLVIMAVILGKEHIDTMELLRFQMERCMAIMKNFTEGQRVDTYYNSDGLTELNNKLHEIRRDIIRLSPLMK